jgi:hypothetical protein
MTALADFLSRAGDFLNLENVARLWDFAARSGAIVAGGLAIYGVRRQWRADRAKLEADWTLDVERGKKPGLPLFLTIVYRGEGEPPHVVSVAIERPRGVKLSAAKTAVSDYCDCYFEPTGDWTDRLEIRKDLSGRTPSVSFFAASASSSSISRSKIRFIIRLLAEERSSTRRQVRLSLRSMQLFDTMSDATRMK